MKKTKFLALLILVPIIFANSVLAKESSISISAGDLIKQVVAGKDFSGEEVLLSGIALSKTGRDSGLLNLGTRQVYNSGVYNNFISVYDTSAAIPKGSVVTVLVKIEQALANKLGKDVFVIIEASFIKCISCQ